MSPCHWFFTRQKCRNTSKQHRYSVSFSSFSIKLPRQGVVFMRIWQLVTPVAKSHEHSARIPKDSMEVFISLTLLNSAHSSMVIEITPGDTATHRWERRRTSAIYVCSQSNNNYYNRNSVLWFLFFLKILAYLLTLLLYISDIINSHYCVFLCRVPPQRRPVKPKTVGLQCVFALLYSYLAIVHVLEYTLWKAKRYIEFSWLLTL